MTQLEEKKRKEAVATEVQDARDAAQTTVE